MARNIIYAMHLFATPFIFVNSQNVYNAATTNLGSNHQVVP